MAIFKNKNFTKRAPECMTIAYCVSEKAPTENWVPWTGDVEGDITKIYQSVTNDGAMVQYWGWV